MLKVKVCGLNDPRNVIEIGEARPDFIGFIFFAQSPRYVGGEPDIELFSNVPPFAKKTGIFVNETTGKILDISQRTGLDAIQLHGNESPVSCLRLKSSGMTLIKAFSIDDEFNFEKLKEYLPACDYFLFDSRSVLQGGSGRKFDWSVLRNYNLDKQFFLSGGIGPDDAGLINSIVHKGLFAVDINSRFEKHPYKKDAQLVKEFINEINTNKR